MVYQPFTAGASSELDADGVRVAASFARVAPRADAFASRLYGLLFERHPTLRGLFPQDFAAQREKLIGALQVAVENLRNEQRLVPLLKDLGRRHANLGVVPAHFAALSEFDAEAWTPDTARAWAKAHARIAEAMKRGLDDERATRSTSLAAANASPWTPAVERPPIRYARRGDVSLAYQVLGSGGVDLLLAMGWLTHLEMGWQSPHVERFLLRLASFSRLILYDKRGTGLSDRVTEGPSPEDRMTDLLSVLDAADADRAVLFGVSESAAACVHFAATHPDRTRALVLYGGNACMLNESGYEHGVDPAVVEGAFAAIREHWGEPLFLEAEAPSLVDDEPFRRWWASCLRAAAGPGDAIALLRAGATLDVRAELASIRAPALVLHRAGDAMMPVAGSRYLAENISGARYVELPGCDHSPYAGDATALLDEVERFVTGLR
jgi:pimeloyl-ACP methyl ester carboxylesterase/hemoglobin-like flavoprotein